MSFRSIALKTLAFGVVMALAVPASAAVEEKVTFSTDRLKVRNLIGEITVESGGSDFEVIVEIAGSEAKAGALRLDKSEDELNIIFPAKQSYVYPRLGKGRDATLDAGSSKSWVGKLVDGMTGRGRIEVSGSGSGTELWADVTIRVPRGAELEVQHGVGKVRVEGAEGELELSTQSGDVEVDGSTGRLAVATGSGDVEVFRAMGEKIAIATGSGDVQAEQLDGDKVNVATGSGSVKVAGARSRAISLATGSGEVSAREVDSDSVSIGTGSGSVTLELDRMGDGDFSVGTGSGDIALRLPSGASVDVRAETDHGKITVALGGEAKFGVKEDDEVEFTVGSGEARVRLGSGSGNIKIGS